ncbi:hypothetical protein O4N70_21220 [Vibrio parahaemolyticus]|uniref:Qat anti-phage system associated protein QatB n=1 Tax=Vibrio parahaemolyticus TaxID=670 RepID=UPI00215B9D7E|nr:Qat anti-phage system associated protein QatB [Vibrio parahaemolyticus]MCR9731616.1 hypothetical protein [Vibrio parahaemolyticus]MCR9752060.1 hypothetical protein [Vibrio parahaemolyticus]MCR9785556.1 hypothetical protein [Vibrio parahaemolyticus]MCR9860479.1 hypothetical protein [Vibrio parahaemolyticus]MCZ6416993.1 hypothetical protein [Vibrio parahaemolyticus]
MGTSQSSNGSPSGVPMVPPWVPQLDQDQSTTSEEASPGSSTQEPTNEPNPPTDIPLIAPHGRFGPARTKLNKFAAEGGNDNLRGGLKHYVKRGYGGSQNAVKRMAGSTSKAGTLYSALLSGADNPFGGTGEALDPVLMSGRSAEEVMDAIVEVVSPVDGTLDAEASRASVKEALSEILDENPDADLLQLTQEQRELAIMHFMAGDVFRRIDLDLGKDIRDNAPNASIGMKRLKEVKDYVKQTIFASFRRLKESGQAASTRTIKSMVTNTIKDTFEIFEAYGL